MGGKKIRSRKSNDSIPVTSLSNRSVNLNSSNSSNVNRNKLPEDLLSLTKEQLKLECRKRGQKTTGTKTELVWFVHRFNLLLLFDLSLLFDF